MTRGSSTEEHGRAVQYLLFVLFLHQAEAKELRKLLRITRSSLDYVGEGVAARDAVMRANGDGVVRELI